MMPYSDPRDRCVYLYLTLMIDSFSCTPFYADVTINNHFTVKYAAFTSAILILTSFSDVRQRPS